MIKKAGYRKAIEYSKLVNERIKVQNLLYGSAKDN